MKTSPRLFNNPNNILSYRQNEHEISHVIVNEGHSYLVQTYSMKHVKHNTIPQLQQNIYDPMESKNMKKNSHMT